MSDSNVTQAYKPSVEPAVIERVQAAIEAIYQEKMHRVTRIKDHIWVISQTGYNLSVIVTHLLVIFDAEMFETMAAERQPYLEELLHLNAHQVKDAKFCLLKEATHLRVLCDNTKIDEERIRNYLTEFKELYLVLETQLAERFFPDLETAEDVATSVEAPPEDQII
ncbi:MAG: hypothetical protein RRB13_14850 [bacterium]|nr:hypothetical protein [bacterium]